MKNLYHSKKSGFTLIEMLVVIAIIAILTGIIMTNLVGSRAKSRDAKRASDLSQIALAIEQYFDRCDVYPATLSTSAGGAGICPNDANNSPITLGNFISVIPLDPSGTGSPLKSANYGYAVNTTDTDYVLYTQFESSNSVLAQSPTNPSWFSSFTCSDQTDFHYCVRPN
jgi:prepilin-type N-terminal cleavage/methylation domain-containing protein